MQFLLTADLFQFAQIVDQAGDAEQAALGLPVPETPLPR